MKNRLFFGWMLFLSSVYASHNITVIGTGYVGLMLGAGLAELNNAVTCADIDQVKVDQLNCGIIPIYEPGLKGLVEHNVHAGHLLFTTDVAHAIEQADVVFIAVGTPMADDGSADLSAVYAVAKTIGKNIHDYKVIATKSTVPIGTGYKIKQIIQEYAPPGVEFDIVSNPEFLREGSAVNDFLHPDRIVVGVESERAQAVMNSIYEPLAKHEVPILWTDVPTAETIKYAANSFLAVKISFINELANLCDKTGADIQLVAQGMGMDKRISSHFLKPGPGFGGSCFPKDAKALIHKAGQHDVPMRVIQACLETNAAQPYVVLEKLYRLLPADAQKIAILGLAFKANTDDVRCAPAIPIIKQLLDDGFQVQAYDPEAMDNMRNVFPGIKYCGSVYDAVTDADACIVMTGWYDIVTMNLAHVAQLMHHQILVDARNMINQDELKKLGFKFDAMGKRYDKRRTRGWYY